MVLENKGRSRFWRLTHALLGKADLSPRPYRLLKNDMAAKLSARSRDGITYDLLADEAERQIAFVGNEGDGLWSKDSDSAIIKKQKDTHFVLLN